MPELNTHPTYSPVHASLCISPCSTQNSGPSGSLLLSREKFSFSASCRFSLAHCNRDLSPIDRGHTRTHAISRPRQMGKPVRTTSYRDQYHRQRLPFEVQRRRCPPRTSTIPKVYGSVPTPPRLAVQSVSAHEKAALHSRSSSSSHSGLQCSCGRSGRRCAGNCV